MVNSYYKVKIKDSDSSTELKTQWFSRQFSIKYIVFAAFTHGTVGRINYNKYKVFIICYKRINNGLITV